MDFFLRGDSTVFDVCNRTALLAADTALIVPQIPEASRLDIAMFERYPKEWDRTRDNMERFLMRLCEHPRGCNTPPMELFGQALILCGDLWWIRSKRL